MTTPMDELHAQAASLGLGLQEPADLAGEGMEEDYTDAVDEPGKERKLTPDGGVVKTIIKVGTGWENPEKGDKVTVHYVGTLENGEKFDSSRDRGDPFTFTLGQGQVIKGWDVGVASMKKGEVSKLTIRSDYGYGDSGSPPKIPGGATLIFEVELLEWKSVKDIAGDGGVIKTIVTEGSGWAKPRDADEVCVRFSARVQGAAAPFYTSPESGEEFYLEKGHFCRALATAAKTMLKGEEVKLVVAPEYGFGAEGRSPDVPPNATLEIDMTLLGWKKVEKVTPDGGVMKKILEEMSEYKVPNADAKVKLSYVARLEDGTVFDERTPDNPLEFTTEEGEAIEGLDLAAMKMRKGEKALLTIKPQYAFGDKESQQPLATVPPNSTVQYEVVMEDFDKPKDSWEMSSDEKVAWATELKERGNAAFKAGAVQRAVKKWERAAEMLSSDTNLEGEAKAAAKAVQKSCSLNLAAAYLKLQQYKQAVESATKVLEADSGNLKALYRRAQGYMGTGDFLEAEMDIKQGMMLDSSSSDFKLLLKKFKAQQASAAKKEAALYSSMFKGLAKVAAKEAAAEKAVGKQPLAENGAAGRAGEGAQGGSCAVADALERAAEQLELGGHKEGEIIMVDPPGA